MLDEHVGHVLFADFEVEGEGAVVVAGEELHAGGFDGCDDEFGLACGYLPKRCGAGLLDLGVGGRGFRRGGRREQGGGVRIQAAGLRLVRRRRGRRLEGLRRLCCRRR